jgi:hypothetical protein
MTITRRLSVTAAALACLQFAIARAAAADSLAGSDSLSTLNRSSLTIASAADDDAASDTTKPAQSSRSRSTSNSSSRGQNVSSADASTKNQTDTSDQTATGRPRIQRPAVTAASTSGDAVSSVRAGSRFDPAIAEPKLLPPNVTGTAQARITPPASDWPAANATTGRPASYSSASMSATNDWNHSQAPARSATQTYQSRPATSGHNSYLMAQTPAPAYQDEHPGGRSVMGNSSVATAQPEVIGSGESMDFSGGGC